MILVGDLHAVWTLFIVLEDARVLQRDADLIEWKIVAHAARFGSQADVERGRDPHGIAMMSVFGTE